MDHRQTLLAEYLQDVVWFDDTAELSACDVLSTIPDLNLQDTQQSAEDSPRSACSTVNSSPSEPTKKKRKFTKNHSQKQREEIVALRVQADELEQTLEKLTMKIRSGVRRQQVMPMGFGQEGMVVWECIAKRQRGEKAKSEVENAKLREMLKCQLRMARSFEILLHKSRLCLSFQDTGCQFAMETHNSCQRLEEMLRDVNARYAVVDTVLVSHGLSDAKPMADIGADATLNFSPTDGMHLEFKEKRVMPFHYQLVDAVVWKTLPEGKLKLEGTRLSVLEHTEDTHISQIMLYQKNAPQIGKAEIISVMKRFQEEGRVVYVWSATMNFYQPNDEDASPSVLTYKGYSTASSTALADTSPGCVVRSYTNSMPSVPNEDLDPEQSQDLGILTEMVFTAYKQSRQNITQTLENLLLDEAVNKLKACQ